MRHCIDTAVVAQLVARALGQGGTAVLAATVGALTMNVGMLAQQERMQASQSPLSEADSALIRAHPAAGVALLRQAGIDQPAWPDCVLMQHEQDDGSGYPAGCAGAHIAQPARVVGLAAVFIRALGTHPIGIFVRLLNGEIGVVTRKGVNSTTPIVDALVGPRGAPLEVVIRRDTQRPNHAIREVLNASQAAVGFRLDLLWGRLASA
ncbi:MAG: HD domain-containing phosphohydrolase [Pseudomonadota bacterium]